MLPYKTHLNFTSKLLMNGILGSFHLNEQEKMGNEFFL